MRLRSDEDGQIIPALLLLLGTLLAGGLLMFGVGRAAVLQAEAVTAADAAALAAATELARQLENVDYAPVDPVAVCAEAARWAERNDAALVPDGCRIIGRYAVRVTVGSQSLEEQGGGTVADSRRGSAQAQAQVDFLGYVGGLGGGGGAGVPTGHLSGNIQDAIRLAQSMGLVVTSTTGGRHTPTSWHYRGMAADVAGSPSQMAAYYRAALARYSNIEELFYDPLGGIKKNQQIGAIGGHSDHVHIALLGNDIGETPPPADVDAGGGPPGLPAGAGLGLPSFSRARLVPVQD